MTSTAPQRLSIDGPAGKLEIAVNDPGNTRRGIAVIAHPHPLYGGTLDNKVVQTLAKAFFALDYCALRLNFRGVGGSDGVFDEGRGELEDFTALVDYGRKNYGRTGLAIGGFSFGGYVAAAAAEKLSPDQLVLAAPAVGRFPVGSVQPNALVVHGEEDDVVPLKDVLDWARPQQLPVTVFPGAGHFFHGALVTLQRLVEIHCRA
ncbi:MAG TPA: alpha/beta fold hydrolase [Burkholderiales bacterium]|nr:alpha/beta fold hydrolase [Burkholderiales bacterium]